jgi:hypothetical protein
VSAEDLLAEARRQVQEELVAFAAPLADDVFVKINRAVERRDAWSIRRESHDWSGAPGLAILRLADAVDAVVLEEEREWERTGLIRCSDCGTRVRTRTLESLPEHRCIERQQANRSRDRVNAGLASVFFRMGPPTDKDRE